jgi:hypothetical protein
VGYPDNPIALKDSSICEPRTKDERRRDDGCRESHPSKLDHEQNPTTPDEAMLAWDSVPE